MNSLPNFDTKNPREYPTYSNAPIAIDSVSTDQRIVKSLSGKVLFWAALAILSILGLFENPLLASISNNQAGIRLLFVVGLALGVCEGIAWRKRNEANEAPRWRRIVLGIVTLVALVLTFHYLVNNNYILSLCQGGVAGSAAWYAIAAFRSNWVAYS